MEICVLRYTQASLYTLCIALTVMSGSVTSEEAPNAASTYHFTMEISNRLYNESLLKPSSADSQILTSQLKGMFYSVYGCPTCSTHALYQRVSAMTFSNHTGSVLVKATLIFQSNQTTADVIKDLFMKAIAASVEINGLKINPDSIQVIAPATPAPPVSSSSHPTKTPTNTTTHPAVHLTTKHHNAASFFHQTHIAYSFSFYLLLLITFSF